MHHSFTKKMNTKKGVILSSLTTESETNLHSCSLFKANESHLNIQITTFILPETSPPAAFMQAHLPKSN